jgi:triosephosphate isomerase
MARNPLVAGNWKMNMTVPQGRELVGYLLDQRDDVSPVEIAVCPPFTALWPIGRQLKGSGSAVRLGAQDMFGDSGGAFTGMISAPMLRDCGCTYVIVGHSERRGRFGKLEGWMTPALHGLFADNDETVAAKARVVLKTGLIPIICCGETIDERKAGKTDQVVSSQVKAALSGLPPEGLDQIVVAYEPVWAIGTGEVCDAPEAQRVCALVRETIRGISAPAADKVRVLYGGSLKPDNADEILEGPDVDGGLVGGASLNGPDFAAIVRAAKATCTA